MPGQDKGVITVGPSYSLAGCSSAEPASASLDKDIITQKTGKETRKEYKVESFVCRIVCGRFLGNRRGSLRILALENVSSVERHNDLVPRYFQDHR
jgi:hypothetical protein